MPAWWAAIFSVLGDEIYTVVIYICLLVPQFMDNFVDPNAWDALGRKDQLVITLTTEVDTLLLEFAFENCKASF